MNTILLDEDKTKAVVLYICQQLGGRVDFLKAFKILYFAEQKHLVMYGRQIIGDSFIKKRRGPVPSTIYDTLKSLRGLNTPSSLVKLSQSIKLVKRHTFIGLENPDIEELSKSDLECLNNSILENSNLTLTEMSAKSHDSAWDSVLFDSEISIYEIAKAGGADAEMIKYIKEYKECHNLEFV